MRDDYPGTAKVLAAPSHRFRTITPDNDNDLTELPKYIVVGATPGNVVLIDSEGNQSTFFAAAGQKVGGEPGVRPRRILATGTVASPIIGVY